MMSYEKYVQERNKAVEAAMKIKDPIERSQKIKMLCMHPGGGELMTKQAEKDETDINVIMANYKQTGVMAPELRTPVYGDFSAEIELRDALDLVQEANESFARLPAAVRAMAQNSPLEFERMMASEGGVAALKAVGLEMAPPKPDPLTAADRAMVDELRRGLREDYLSGKAPAESKSEPQKGGVTQTN